MSYQRERAGLRPGMTGARTETAVGTPGKRTLVEDLVFAQAASLAPVQRKLGAGAPDGGDGAREGLAAPASGGEPLPAALRIRMEARSGLSLGDVRVHRNSERPARIGAYAYAQGNDIYLGPGQELHLAHEVWHVVQQRQGRVAATNAIAGLPANTEPALEAEADAAAAHDRGAVAPREPSPTASARPWTLPPIVQGMMGPRTAESIDRTADQEIRSWLGLLPNQHLLWMLPLERLRAISTKFAQSEPGEPPSLAVDRFLARLRGDLGLACSGQPLEVVQDVMVELSTIHATEAGRSWAAATLSDCARALSARLAGAVFGPARIELTRMYRCLAPLRSIAGVDELIEHVRPHVPVLVAEDMVSRLGLSGVAPPPEEVSTALRRRAETFGRRDFASLPDGVRAEILALTDAARYYAAPAGPGVARTGERFGAAELIEVVSAVLRFRDPPDALRDLLEAAQAEASRKLAGQRDGRGTAAERTDDLEATFDQLFSAFGQARGDLARVLPLYRAAVDQLVARATSSGPPSLDLVKATVTAFEARSALGSAASWSERRGGKGSGRVASAQALRACEQEVTGKLETALGLLQGRIRSLPHHRTIDQRRMLHELTRLRTLPAARPSSDIEEPELGDGDHAPAEHPLTTEIADTFTHVSSLPPNVARIYKMTPMRKAQLLADFAWLHAPREPDRALIGSLIAQLTAQAGSMSHDELGYVVNIVGQIHRPDRQVQAFLDALIVIVAQRIRDDLAACDARFYANVIGGLRQLRGPIVERFVDLMAPVILAHLQRPEDQGSFKQLLEVCSTYVRLDDRALLAGDRSAADIAAQRQAVIAALRGALRSTTDRALSDRQVRQTLPLRGYDANLGEAYPTTTTAGELAELRAASEQQFGRMSDATSLVRTRDSSYTVHTVTPDGVVLGSQTMDNVVFRELSGRRFGFVFVELDAHADAERFKGVVTVRGKQYRYDVYGGSKLKPGDDPDKPMSRKIQAIGVEGGGIEFFNQMFNFKEGFYYAQRSLFPNDDRPTVGLQGKLRVRIYPDHLPAFAFKDPASGKDLPFRTYDGWGFVKSSLARTMSSAPPVQPPSRRGGNMPVQAYGWYPESSAVTEEAVAHGKRAVQDAGPNLDADTLYRALTTGRAPMRNAVAVPVQERSNVVLPANSELYAPASEGLLLGRTPYDNPNLRAVPGNKVSYRAAGDTRTGPDPELAASDFLAGMESIQYSLTGYTRLADTPGNPPAGKPGTPGAAPAARQSPGDLAFFKGMLGIVADELWPEELSQIDIALSGSDMKLSEAWEGATAKPTFPAQTDVAVHGMLVVKQWNAAANHVGVPIDEQKWLGGDYDGDLAAIMARRENPALYQHVDAHYKKTTVNSKLDKTFTPANQDVTRIPQIQDVVSSVVGTWSNLSTRINGLPDADRRRLSEALLPGLLITVSDPQLATLVLQNPKRLEDLNRRAGTAGASGPLGTEPEVLAWLGSAGDAARDLLRHVLAVELINLELQMGIKVGTDSYKTSAEGKRYAERGRAYLQTAGELKVADQPVPYGKDLHRELATLGMPSLESPAWRALYARCMPARAQGIPARVMQRMIVELDAMRAGRMLGSPDAVEAHVAAWDLRIAQDEQARRATQASSTGEHPGAGEAAAVPGPSTRATDPAPDELEALDQIFRALRDKYPDVAAAAEAGVPTRSSALGAAAPHASDTDGAAEDGEGRQSPGPDSDADEDADRDADLDTAVPELGAPSGMPNVDNTCYLGSVLQLIAATPTYVDALVAAQDLGLAAVEQILAIVEKLQLGSPVADREVEHLAAACLARGWLSGGQSGLQQDASELLNQLLQDIRFDAGLRYQGGQGGSGAAVGSNPWSHHMLLLPAGDEPRPMGEMVSGEFGGDGARIEQLPEALTIHVDRHGEAGFGGAAFQRMQPVVDPLHLHIPADLVPGEPEQRYELTACVIHRGDTASSGHYVCYVRVRDTWWLCDDARVTRATTEDVTEACALGYLFVYAKTATHEPIEALAQSGIPLPPVPPAGPALDDDQAAASEHRDDQDDHGDDGDDGDAQPSAASRKAEQKREKKRRQKQRKRDQGAQERAEHEVLERAAAESTALRAATTSRPGAAAETTSETTVDPIAPLFQQPVRTGQEARALLLRAATLHGPQASAHQLAARTALSLGARLATLRVDDDGWREQWLPIGDGLAALDRAYPGTTRATLAALDDRVVEVGTQGNGPAWATLLYALYARVSPGQGVPALRLYLRKRGFTMPWLMEPQDAVTPGARPATEARHVPATDPSTQGSAQDRAPADDELAGLLDAHIDDIAAANHLLQIGATMPGSPQSASRVASFIMQCVARMLVTGPLGPQNPWLPVAEALQAYNTAHRGAAWQAALALRDSVQRTRPTGGPADRMAVLVVRYVQIFGNRELAMEWARVFAAAGFAGFANAPPAATPGQNAEPSSSPSAPTTDRTAAQPEPDVAVPEPMATEPTVPAPTQVDHLARLRDRSVTSVADAGNLLQIAASLPGTEASATELAIGVLLRVGMSFDIRGAGDALRGLGRGLGSFNTAHPTAVQTALLALHTAVASAGPTEVRQRQADLLCALFAQLCSPADLEGMIALLRGQGFTIDEQLVALTPVVDVGSTQDEDGAEQDAEQDSAQAQGDAPEQAQRRRKRGKRGKAKREDATE